MRRVMGLGLGLGVLALLVLGAIGARLGVVAPPPRPDGPWVWVAARAAGVTALLALALDVIGGLVLSTGVLDRRLPRARSLELHRALSGIALTLTAGHVLLLLADPYIRYDLFDVIVPGVSSYRPMAVAAGIVAAYLALVVHVSFALRAWLGPRTWRRLHYLSFAVLVGALGHGLTSGTDTGRAGLQVFYPVVAAAVAALTAVRVVMAVQARAPARE